MVEVYKDHDYKAVAENYVIKFYKKDELVLSIPYNPEVHQLLEKTKEVFLVYKILSWAIYEIY